MMDNERIVTGAEHFRLKVVVVFLGQGGVKEIRRILEEEVGTPDGGVGQPAPPEYPDMVGIKYRKEPRIVFRLDPENAP